MINKIKKSYACFPFRKKVRKKMYARNFFCVELRGGGSAQKDKLKFCKIVAPNLTRTNDPLIASTQTNRQI